ncbi:hypothetical protein K9U34_04730 [Lawsonia intracellularis]|uniref:Uncharacterized protein n=1 Tax=Lawsonia intracellularis (strain PHE/MN1-00) TaxID=363253 RepID=Q1MPK6_LAWIP|nr:hypothetical protein [Lawsonia intracellularis]AGC50450.1 hypothetical protein LAW_01055 [Lawsonia intracellularis N343]KAA0204472.1 hypothetical protein C4K43_05690 [Lawsonia intracellularis]MBZ3892898.1 hypothetical protein [Lawsonia intracellularis]OMQ02919.1 hypothetical protein BW722_05530 [Lawsonia intracellularis]RBN32943.1 hypothetical protein DR194_00690 [Lawsonia intracellularis]
MIIIDGNKTDMQIKNFSNLEEILLYAASDSRLENRIVTDVLLNDELFSELYPHQAEDIPTNEINSVEIRSIPFGEMAYNITEELLKVSNFIATGSKEVAQHFRRGEDDEGLELFQDLLDVIRDFMTMVSVLRTDFIVTDDNVFADCSEQISSLLSEMTDVLEQEDWIMLADLLEYELIPACERWNIIIEELRKAIQNNLGA